VIQPHKANEGNTDYPILYMKWNQKEWDLSEG